MTITLLRRLGPLLVGSVAAFGPSTACNAAEELRIGYVAPTTGIFAQVGKDMVDGFQLYLDDINSDFGGAKVKFIVEDEQGKPDTAVTRAKKLAMTDWQMSTESSRRRSCGSRNRTRTVRRRAGS